MRPWHPDAAQNEAAASHEKSVLLNESYRILVEYCTNYPFSFQIEDIARNLEKSPADYWMERFGGRPDMELRCIPDRGARGMAMPV